MGERSKFFLNVKLSMEKDIAISNLLFVKVLRNEF